MVTAAFSHRSPNCTCDHCDKTFYKTPSRIRESQNNFCSAECRGLFNRKRSLVVCLTCGQQFEKNDCYIERTEKSFCSNECYQQYPDKINRLDCRRSRAEDYLYKLITNDFPQLSVSKNDTNILGNNMEIDLAIPTLKIAIEVNGPVHYKELFGKEVLKKTQERDRKKADILNKIGYQLIILDISEYHNFKRAQPYVLSMYETALKPKLTT